jgi:hypothetical protein
MCRPRSKSHRRDDPARTGATSGWRRAWRPSGAEPPVGRPLGGRGPMVQPAATGPRRSAAGPARSLTATGRSSERSHTHHSPAVQDRDLLALAKRQIAPRQWRPADRWHAAFLTKHRTPTAGDTPAATPVCSLDKPLVKSRPESLPILMARDGRPSRHASAPALFRRRVRLTPSAGRDLTPSGNSSEWIAPPAWSS